MRIIRSFPAGLFILGLALAGPPVFSGCDGGGETGTTGPQVEPTQETLDGMKASEEYYKSKAAGKK